MKKKNAKLFFVALGIVLLSVGMLLFAWMLQLHVTVGRIPPDLALLAMFSIWFGIPILTVGLVEYFVVTKTNQ